MSPRPRERDLVSPRGQAHADPRSARARGSGPPGLSAAGAGSSGARSLELSVLGTYETGIFAGGAQEIVAFAAGTDRLFVVNAGLDTVDVLDASDPSAPAKNNKGPEPEGIELGVVGKSLYAFVGLERIGGIMVRDITSPHGPRFVQYLNNRDFTGDPETGTAGDLGPEGLHFIARNDSPIGVPLLAVANEVSGTTTLYRIDVRP